MLEDAAPPLDLKALQHRLSEALRARLGCELELTAEWPELVAGQEQPGVIITFALSAATQAESLWLWLDPALASNLVDRALGGRGELGIATLASALSEAECGVLAYLAARAAHAFAPLVVRDVTAKPRALAAEVLWPFRVGLGATSGAMRVGLSAALSEQRLACRIGFREQLSQTDAAALEVGDVLMLDELALSVTTHGLSGPCVLAASGIDDALPALLDGPRLLPRKALAPRGSGAQDVLLVLEHTQLSLAALARLRAGEPLSAPIGASKSIAIERADDTLAHAALVKLRAGLGLQITARGYPYSMR